MLGNESIVSKLTTYVHVPDFHLLNDNEAYQHFDFYLLTLRDPLSRALSALTYMHPLNQMVPTRQTKMYKIYFNCFQTMDEFTQYLSDDEFEIYGDPSYFDPLRAIENVTNCKAVW